MSILDGKELTLHKEPPEEVARLAATHIEKCQCGNTMSVGDYEASGCCADCYYSESDTKQ
jgi:hypothetical protein